MFVVAHPEKSPHTEQGLGVGCGQLQSVPGAGVHAPPGVGVGKHISGGGVGENVARAMM